MKNQKASKKAKSRVAEFDSPFREKTKTVFQNFKQSNFFSFSSKSNAGRADEHKQSSKNKYSSNHQGSAHGEVAANQNCMQIGYAGSASDNNGYSNYNSRVLRQRSSLDEQAVQQEPLEDNQIQIEEEEKQENIMPKSFLETTLWGLNETVYANNKEETTSNLLMNRQISASTPRDNDQESFRKIEFATENLKEFETQIQKFPKLGGNFEIDDEDYEISIDSEELDKDYEAVREQHRQHHLHHSSSLEPPSAKKLSLFEIRKRQRLQSQLKNMAAKLEAAQLKEEEEKLKKRDSCKEKTTFNPNHGFKLKWDLFIILLSIYNAILAPLEFGFSGITSSFKDVITGDEDTIGTYRVVLSIIDLLIDICFFLDIIFNFRTIYFDPKTEEPISDMKKIAMNYTFKGRFLIDLAASFPFDEITGASAGTSSTQNKQLEFLRMLKLIRLLRLGRMITFLKVNQNFKFGMKIIVLVFMLFIVIHFNACFWQYVYSQNNEWIPPKDEDKEQIPEYHDESLYSGNWSNGEKYILDFYYSILAMVGNDLLPKNLLEVTISTLYTLLGSIVIGIIIGDFSSILSEMQKKARQQSEEIDMIQAVMTNLKVGEAVQNRVFEFYEQLTEAKVVRGEQLYSLLNENLGKAVKLHQMEWAIRGMGLLGQKGQIEEMANLIKLAMYLPGDVMVKQDDIGEQFFVIIDGMAEVCQEKEDYKFYDFEHQHQFIGNSKQWMAEQERLDQKRKSIFLKMVNKGMRGGGGIPRLSLISQPKSQDQYSKPHELNLSQHSEGGSHSSKQDVSQPTPVQNRAIRRGGIVLVRQNSSSVSLDGGGTSQDKPTQRKVSYSSVSEISQSKESSSRPQKATYSSKEPELTLRSTTEEKKKQTAATLEEEAPSKLKTINELKEGDYFGEICLLTKMKRTCSVYAISQTICGYINKAEFKQLTQQNMDFQSKLFEKMNNYKDSTFRFITIMLRNIQIFRQMPSPLLQKVIYKLRSRKFLRNQIILQMGEQSDQCFFIEQGRVGIYVYTGDLSDHSNESNQDGYHDLSFTKKLKLFGYLDRGSYFNLAHFVLEKESLFIFRAETQVRLYVLQRKDFGKLATGSERLQAIVDLLRVLYDLEGCKYDFGRMHFKDLKQMVETIQRRHEESPDKRIEFSTASLGVNSPGGISEKQRRKIESEILQNAKEKFARTLKSLMKRGFHINQLTIFKKVDDINNRRMEKERLRVKKTEHQLLLKNPHYLEMIKTINNYLNTANYYSSNPELKEINEYVENSSDDSKSSSSNHLSAKIHDRYAPNVTNSVETFHRDNLKVGAESALLLPKNHCEVRGSHSFRLYDRQLKNQNNLEEVKSAGKRQTGRFDRSQQSKVQAQREIMSSLEFNEFATGEQIRGLQGKMEENNELIRVIETQMQVQLQTFSNMTSNQIMKFQDQEESKENQVDSFPFDELLKDLPKDHKQERNGPLQDNEDFLRLRSSIHQVINPVDGQFRNAFNEE